MTTTGRDEKIYVLGFDASYIRWLTVLRDFVTEVAKSLHSQDINKEDEEGKGDADNAWE